jgi:opacity protein-like surface antigen
MMAEDYAVTFAGTYSLFGEENKPGTNAAPGDPIFRYTQKAWSLRLGGDRVVKLGDRSYLFFGPGIEYWSGKAKFEFEGTTVSRESENISRISLSGRLGAHMMIGESWGMTLQGGHKVGYASYQELGAKSTWWPSSFDASGGLVYRFGD